jgi:hypothetical protein
MMLGRPDAFDFYNRKITALETGQIRREFEEIPWMSREFGLPPQEHERGGKLVKLDPSSSKMDSHYYKMSLDNYRIYQAVQSILCNLRRGNLCSVERAALQIGLLSADEATRLNLLRYALSNKASAENVERELSRDGNQEKMEREGFKPHVVPSTTTSHSSPRFLSKAPPRTGGPGRGQTPNHSSYRGKRGRGQFRGSSSRGGASQTGSQGGKGKGKDHK